MEKKMSIWHMNKDQQTLRRQNKWKIEMKQETFQPIEKKVDFISQKVTWNN
jgi:hypothetical protein